MSGPRWAPPAASRQRDRVEGYIAQGIADGFTLATGGGRPKDLDRAWFVEPTVFGNVDNHSAIAQEEIFGQVLSVIPAQDEGLPHFRETKFVILEGRPAGYENTTL